MKANYRFLSHTADAGIEVISPTLQGVYETAGRALFQLIAPGDGAAKRTRTIATTGDDREALLINFLNDLLWVFEVERLMCRRIIVQELDAQHIVAEACCDELEPGGEGVDTVVKAVTWHGLKVEPDGSHWRGVFFLDL